MCDYKKHARDKGHLFLLTDDEFKHLIGGNCFYCAAEPANRKKSDAGKVLIYNGIDRLDSSIGYIKENCVTCCKPCNWMKKDMLLEEFLTRVRTIAARHPKAPI
jgi:hypothetical protein